MTLRSARGKLVLAFLTLGIVLGSLFASAGPASAGQANVKYEYDSRGRLVHRFACIPKTCAEQGKTCGSTSDGCGQDLQCGTCVAGSTCTTSNTCCADDPCTSAGATCGVVPNACGGTTACGICGVGEACTDTNTCCAPKSCEVLAKQCGIVSDQCGGLVHCGDCTADKICDASNICCTPKTCVELGASCGTVGDGCGGTIACGSCGQHEFCENNACVESDDVGVIPGPGTLCPPGMGSARGPYGDLPYEIYMDDEDSTWGDNANQTSGWIGGMSQSQYGTTYHFCRVPGRHFKPLATTSLVQNHYAVLKLATNCPVGSVDFVRYFDNEDGGNANSPKGDTSFAPNVVGDNTWMHFCLFRGGTETMQAFPDLGFEYAVFADSSFSRALETGWIFEDDEDDGNANSLTPADVHTDAARIISDADNQNTTIRIAKVGAAPKAIVLTATPDGMAINLQWTNSASSRIVGYDVERATPYSAWTRIGSTSSAATSFVDDSVDPNADYRYRVRAYTASEAVVLYSNEAHPTALDARPTMLSVDQVGMALVLNWYSWSWNAAGFQIERKIGDTGTWTLIQSIAGGPYWSWVTYADADTEPDTTYYYRVRAFNNGGYVTAYSNEASGVQLPASAPSGLTVTAPTCAGTVLDLAWVDNATPYDSGFNIERKIGTTGSWTPLAATLYKAGYRDLSVSSGVTYCYRLRAYNTVGGYTLYSDEACGVTNEPSTETCSFRVVLPITTPTGTVMVPLEL